MSTPGAQYPRVVAGGDFLGQPVGLTVLFMTEAWEKFSFFGMRALLVLYLVKSMHFDQSKSSIVYAWYTGLIYLTPIFGGYISDKWLGKRRSVIIGGLLMALGHFLMTFNQFLYLGMALIILGNGLYLPSLPSQIGALYHKDDPRRTSAYSIYYLGVNVGALAGGAVCGILGEVYGWHWGFGAAGVGMCLGLVIYLGGSKYLPSAQALKGGPVPEVEPGEAQNVVRPEPAALSKWTGPAILLPLSVIVLIIVCFRTAYEQIGNTLSLWIDSADRHLGSWDVPASVFQSINPAMVLLLTPLLVFLWTRSAARGRKTPQLVRMAIGAFIVALSYVAVVAIDAAGISKLAPWGTISIFLFIVLLTVGELYILPVGLALFGERAPKGYESTTIALWFLGGSAGNLAAGYLGASYTSLGVQTFFLVVAGISALAGVGLLLCRVFLKPLR
jgi:POT family proton-dependent oligopeptide transporter